MRSELNVTHSKKLKEEVFGDHPIAFVSWWLLWCPVATWPGCWNRVTWLDDLPVDGREVVPSLVSVQGGALPGDVDGFRYPLQNQSVSWWRMETSFSESECLRWLRWWPTGKELRWCSETHLRRLLSVSPTYVASQSEHWIWYTTPPPVRPWELCPWGVPGGSAWCCKVWGARTLSLRGWFCR